MPDTVILLAAGRSSRMDNKVEDKILAPLGGRPVFLYSWQAFQTSRVVDSTLIVYRDQSQRKRLEEILADESPRPGPTIWVEGGPERRDSVRRALAHLPDPTDFVYIHDTARPFITASILRQLRDLVRVAKAVTLARPVTDTIKQVEPATPPARGCLLRDLDRSRLWAMETPQVFVRNLIEAAYREAQARQAEITDDTAAVSLLGHPVALLAAPFWNLKLTTPGDFALAESLLQSSRGGHSMAPPSLCAPPPLKTECKP